MAPTLPWAEDGAPAAAQLETLIRRLQPICRSITGNGVRETLSILQQHLDALTSTKRTGIPVAIERTELPTGTPIYDWTVPDEWNITAASVSDTSGRRLIDFASCALHVVSYSEPVDRWMSFDELRPHLHTMPDRPDWIPYRTSYHTRTWGFCVADTALGTLQDAGQLHVSIDSTLATGSLTLGQIVIPGQTQRELLLSTHTCHPWMVNDNVSGMVALATLAARLAQRDRPLRHTVRILFVPATVGSLAWLATHGEILERIDGGLVVTGLADDAPLTYKQSRLGTTPFDHTARAVLNRLDPQLRLLDWDPYGYDERQFCSPGIDLPVGRLTRGIHGKYAEYHTSADDLGFASGIQLQNAINAIEQVIDQADSLDLPRVRSGRGEPQLGRRGLYRSTGGTVDSRSTEMAYLWMLSLADGNHTIEDIQRASGLPWDAVLDARRKLEAVELLY
jgi:aminopeptidase-like protein